MRRNSGIGNARFASSRRTAREWTAEDVAREYEYYIGGQISLDEAQEIAWMLNDTGADIAEMLEEWVKLDMEYASRKTASDGWDEGICSELISVLEKCQELCYEVENARRGAYCREAGNTYESLGAYAYRLGEDLMNAGGYLEDVYGDMTVDEIDEM